MANSVTIGQALAAELGLPEAQGAPAGRVFAVGRLLEWQEVRMKEIEARRKRRVQSAFLPARGRRLIYLFSGVGFYQVFQLWQIG